MNDIDLIYRNEFGLSFYWKSRRDKIQLVFRNTGFHLSLTEAKDFRDLVRKSMREACCEDCPSPQSCRSLLLKTPSSKIDLAVNLQELAQINELLGGTIFKMEQAQFLETCHN